MNERDLFIAALHQRDPAARAALLDRACAGDQTLRLRIEELLREQEQLGSFLERSAERLGDTGAFTPPEGGETVVTLCEGQGTVIGPYKLLEPIGEGGMGTVYLAQQSEPVKRLVALKVIKAGMDSRQIIARFEAERHALALMDHPHIAKVLAVVPPSSGRPFFVMELVKGVPFTKYCDEQCLTPRQRRELFIPVCQAIQHAHQKGIIHRDIKPSNVLAALYDGRPVPKVIDFGVAKATAEQLTEKTLVTGFGAVVGTLEYMSPEQAELNQLDIDTRSDVYSLGVLLYELLTGTTPLERKRLKDTGLMEALRLIREEEPPRPSTRLSEAKDTLPSISAQRQTEPAKLTKLVRGELDWIVMKALEKDRNRRYETANGLARDVQRYLADEPVLACPPSRWYRLRKFAQRNRAALVTMVLIAAALLSTVIALVISYISISREEKEKSEALIAKDDALKAANTSRQQAEANLPLILAALDEVYITEAEKRLSAYRSEPKKSAVAQDPRQAQLDREFLQKGMGFYETLIQPGNAEPTARFQTGKAYRRVGMLQRELKQLDKAADSLAKAISLLDKLAEESPTEPQYRSELAQAYFDKIKETQRQRAKRLLNDPAALNDCAWQMVSDRDPRLRDPAGAVELANRAVDLAPQAGRFWTTLGVSHYRAGDHAKAIEALTHSLTLNGANATDLLFLAMAHWQRGLKEEARQWYDAAVLRMEYGSPWRFDDGAVLLRQEAETLMGLARNPKAAAPQTKLVDPECYTHIIAAQPGAAWAYQLRAQIYRRLGNTPQAEADTRRAYELLRRNLPTGPDALKELKPAGAQPGPIICVPITGIWLSSSTPKRSTSRTTNSGSTTSAGSPTSYSDSTAKPRAITPRSSRWTRAVATSMLGEVTPTYA